MQKATISNSQVRNPAVDLCANVRLADNVKTDQYTLTRMIPQLGCC
jgi:hypothetical protein